MNFTPPLLKAYPLQKMLGGGPIKLLVLLPAEHSQIMPNGRPMYHGSCEFEHLVGGCETYLLRLSPMADIAGHREMITRQKFDLVFNAISTPDMHRETLFRAGQIVDGLPVINPPEKILRHGRDEVASALDGIDGLHVPRCVRFMLDNPPAYEGTSIILRKAGTATGVSMLLAHSQHDVDLYLSEAQDGDHFATDYREYKSPDGLYRKYRVRMSGGLAIPGHLFISDQWKVHMQKSRELMLQSPALIDEEASYLRDALPQEHVRIFQEIDRRIGVDHYGIDYSILPDRRLVLFEANAEMRSYYPEWEEQFPAIVGATERLKSSFGRHLRSLVSG